MFIFVAVAATLTEVALRLASVVSADLRIAFHMPLGRTVCVELLQEKSGPTKCLFTSGQM